MEQLIGNVDGIILGFVQGSFDGLSGAIQTLWRLMFIVFIGIYGYKVIISGRFSAPDLLVHCMKIILVLAMATQWDAFFTFIYRMTTEFPSDLAGTLITAASDSLGAQSHADSVQTANNALGNFFDRGMVATSRLLESAGISNIDLYFYGGAVALGTIMFTGYATMLILMAKIGVAILLAIGPIFILLLVFTNTRTLFDGWLRVLLSYALVPVFVYAMLALLLALAETPLRYLEENSGVNDRIMNALGPFLLVTFVSTMLMRQIMSIAASVTGGGSLSTTGLPATLWKKGTGIFERNESGSGETRQNAGTYGVTAKGYKWDRESLISRISKGRQEAI